uniref:Uncharacterized protein n=1 Tax=Ciona intestinalis TaxID=7719 RepID=F6PPW2_CIOIN
RKVLLLLVLVLVTVQLVDIATCEDFWTRRRTSWKWNEQNAQQLRDARDALEDDLLLANAFQ